jgi:hypothetical protein
MVMLAGSCSWPSQIPAGVPMPGLTHGRPRAIALLTAWSGSPAGQVLVYMARKSWPRLPSPTAVTVQPDGDGTGSSRRPVQTMWPPRVTRTCQPGFSRLVR